MIIMIIVTMMKKTMIIYDSNHKLAKQRNRERRFDGLRLSPNVSLSLILFLVWINRKKFLAPTWTKYSLCVLSIWIAYTCGRLKKYLFIETIQLYKVTTRTEISNKFIFPVRNGLQVGHREDLETHAKLHTCILLTKIKKKVVWACLALQSLDQERLFSW